MLKVSSITTDAECGARLTFLSCERPTLCCVTRSTLSTAVGGQSLNRCYDLLDLHHDHRMLHTFTTKSSCWQEVIKGRRHSRPAREMRISYTHSPESSAVCPLTQCWRHSDRSSCVKVFRPRTEFREHLVRLTCVITRPTFVCERSLRGYQLAAAAAAAAAAAECRPHCLVTRRNQYTGVIIHTTSSAAQRAAADGAELLHIIPLSVTHAPALMHFM